MKIKLKNKIKNPMPRRKNEKKREAYDPRKHGISVSALSRWLTCRESSRLHYVQGWRPIQTKRAFVHGSIYHDILEAYRLALVEGDDPESVILEKIDEKEAAAEKSVDYEESMVAIERARALLPAYAEYYAGEDSTYDWTKPEEEFKLPVMCQDHELILHGFFDSGYTNSNKRWCVESKFWERWGEYRIDSLVMDLQVNSYVAALDYMGNTPGGCLYDIVRKPGLRRKQGESLEEYCERIKEDIDDRPHHYFHRHRISFTKKDIAMAKRRIEKLMYEYVEWWLEAKDYTEPDPMLNAGACETKYGACQFIPICAHGDVTAFERRG